MYLASPGARGSNPGSPGCGSPAGTVPDAVRILIQRGRVHPGDIHAPRVVVVSKGSVPMNLAKSKNASHFRSSSPGSQGHVHRQQSFEAEHMNKLKLLLRNLLKCLAAWPYSGFHLLSSLVSSLAHCEKNVATAADLSASHSQRTSPATAARKASQKPKMKAGNPKKRQKKGSSSSFVFFRPLGPRARPP